jgi:hypothetical protein
MADYVNGGDGRVLMDSGAYREFRSGELLDWGKVLGRYEQLAGMISPEHLERIWFVAPDAIGDAQETARRQTLYGSTCGGLQARGAQIVIPLQFDPASIRDEASFIVFARRQWRESLAALGLSHGILGFPARLVTPSPLLIKSLSEALPGLDSIHMLGCGKHEVLTDYASHSLVPVSGDANILRRFITEELSTECRDKVIDDSLIEAVRGDDTEWYHELFNETAWLPREQVDLLASMMGMDPDGVWEAHQREGENEYGCALGDLLDAAYFDHWYFGFIRACAEKFPVPFSRAREQCLAARLAQDMTRRASSPVQLGLFAA